MSPYPVNHRLPHCSAIAAAIPEYVRLRFFQRSGLGGSRCTRATLPSTMAVGTSLGRFLSHRQVDLTSPCPNCQGWMIWSGFRIRVEMMPIGFSIAIRFTEARNISLTNTSAASCSPILSLNHLAPLTAKCVHGGKAIIKSQTPANQTSRITSPWMCGPGFSLGNRSHDTASCPRAMKASRTIPENSHATRTFTLPPFSALCACAVLRLCYSAWVDSRAQSWLSRLTPVVRRIASCCDLRCQLLVGDPLADNSVNERIETLESVTGYKSMTLESLSDVNGNRGDLCI